MADFALLAGLVIAAWCWLESRRVQEITVAHCRRACENADVQFLDDIAPVWGIKLARDANGVMRLRRVYTFDYSDRSGARRSGSIVMLGRTAVAVHFERNVPVR